MATIAIDFDGTIIPDSGNIASDFLAWKCDEIIPPLLAGAVEIINNCGILDDRLVIYTARPWQHMPFIEDVLTRHNIRHLFDDIICGKYPAALYVDDKAAKPFLPKKPTEEPVKARYDGQEPVNAYENWLRKRRWEVLGDFCKEKNILDVGCGEHVEYPDWVENVIAVDSDPKKLQAISKNPKVCRVYRSLADINYRPQLKLAVLMGVLEHMDNPRGELTRLRDMGIRKLFITVPNGWSLNRQIGAILGYLKNPCALGEHDIAIGHKQMGSVHYWKKLIYSALGQNPEAYPLGFKPLPSSEMTRWTEEQWGRMDGLASTDNSAELVFWIDLDA